MKRFCITICSLILFSISVIAQSEQCPVIIESALDSLDNFCQNAERNQACYGNVNLVAEPKSDISDFQFEQIGDIVDLTDIESMQLSPLDETTGEWGLVLMQLQADIPNTLPGQNVTFILFGDVQLIDVSEDDENPMQAFFLHTGVGETSCSDAPQDGLLVQTPEGVEQVAFNINGVDVQVGSTVFFQATPGEEMIVNTVEGTAAYDFDGEIYPAIAGTRMRLPVDDDLLPRGLPELPEQYQAEQLRRLPVHLLQRRIDVADTLDDDILLEFHRRMRNGELPCNAPGLPSCEDLSIRADLARVSRAGWAGQLPLPIQNNFDMFREQTREQRERGQQLPGQLQGIRDDTRDSLRDDLNDRMTPLPFDVNSLDNVDPDNLNRLLEDLNSRIPLDQQLSLEELTQALEIMRYNDRISQPTVLDLRNTLGGIRGSDTGDRNNLDRSDDSDANRQIPPTNGSRQPLPPQGNNSNDDRFPGLSDGEGEPLISPDDGGSSSPPPPPDDGGSSSPPPPPDDGGSSSPPPPPLGG